MADDNPKKGGASRKRKAPSPEPSTKRLCCPAVDPRAFDADILAYQAPYMKVRLSDYKRRVVEMEGRIAELEEGKKRDGKVVHVVKHAWNNLVDNMEMMLVRVDVAASLPPPSNLSSSKGSNTNSMTSFLQKMVDQQSTSPNKVELDEGTDLLEKQLAEKTKSSQSILLKIVQSLEAQRNQSEELSAMLRFDKDADSVQSALVDENKRLTEALAKSEQNLDMMHLRVKEMTEEKSKISDDLLLLKEQSRRWKKERDEINVKYQASIQKVDSLTLVPPPQLAMKRIKKEETSSSSSSSSSSSLASSQEKRLSVKKEKGVGGGEASATSEETEKLKIELEETKLLAEKRLNEINEIGSKYSSLVKSSESLKQSLGSMSGELVVSNPTFLETKKAAEFYQKEYNDVFNRYEGVKRETAALKRELEDQRLSFEDKIAQKIEEFAKIHREREAQMIMFRRERDALAWKLEERDAQPSQEDLIRELRVLTTSQAEHLKRLRGRLERGGGGCEDVDMASSSSPSSNSVSSSSNSNSSHLGEENQKLQNEVKELKSQITEWSKQEKKWSEKKRDMEILIDTYKKTGKDRRDVIEVKKNEKKLQEDCEELTKRVKELEEDIAGYKKVTSVDIRGSDPAMSQMQAEKDALSGEVKKLERKNAQLAKAKETQEEETKTLLMEIDEISKAYEEIQEQNDRLSSQVEEKNDATSRLVSERLKARKIQQRMTEENGLLQERESRLFEKIEVQHSLVRVTESKLKAMQELVFRLQEDVRGMQGAVEREKKNAKEEGERVADLQTRVDGLVGEIEDAKKESVERRVELEEKASVLRRVEEEKERLQRKVERANKSASLSKSSEVAEEEIKELRRQLQCDVCKDRRKGCIVTKCWHIFCRQCIEDSLTARRRKCPACGRAISRNEVQDIYL